MSVCNLLTETLDCCCGGMEKDFCQDCVLARRARCYPGHHLHWGVRPLSTTWLASTTASDRRGLRVPQKVLTLSAHATSKWMMQQKNPHAMISSIRRYIRVSQQLQEVQDGLARGTVRAKIASQSSAVAAYNARILTTWQTLLNIATTASSLRGQKRLTVSPHAQTSEDLQTPRNY